MDEETDAELLARHAFVVEELTEQRRRYERMKLGSPARTRKAQWCGCLEFNRLSIESKMRDRGIIN